MKENSPADIKLGFRTHLALRGRHSWKMLRDVGGYTVLNDAWWLLPIVLLILIVALAAGATQQVVPYAVYTLF